MFYIVFGIIYLSVAIILFMFFKAMIDLARDNEKTYDEIDENEK